MNINVAGLSTLRKKEDKPREKKSDRSHNLQAYLDEQYGSAKVKKKKRKKKYASSRGLEIVDADIDTSCFKESSPKEGVEEEDNEPVIVNAGEFRRMQLQEQRQKDLLQRDPNGCSGFIATSEGLDRKELLSDHEDGDEPSPPRRNRHDSSDDSDDNEPSPPRRNRHDSSDDSDDNEPSPPRRNRHDSSDGSESPPRRRIQEGNEDAIQLSIKNANSSANRMSDGTLAGMISGKDLAKEMENARRRERNKFEGLDDTITGKNAATVYRADDGRAMSKSEYLESLQKKKQNERKFLEGSEIPWGKGLKQTKAFRDAQSSAPVPSRWDDPMSHILGKKQSSQDPTKFKSGSLLDIYAKELQKAGFNVPLAIPSHSWLHRHIGPPPNRYGIKPGRHWDGVDRSNGFERDLFRRQAELKQREQMAHFMAQEDM